MKDIAHLTGIAIVQLRLEFAKICLQARTQFSSVHNTVNYKYHSLMNFDLDGKKILQ